jgi:hypothetical protein
MVMAWCTDRTRIGVFLCLVAVLFCTAMLPGGCQTPEARGYIEKSKVERQIADLQAGFQQKLEQSNRNIITAKDEVIAGKDAQEQAATDALYGQSLVFASLVEPTRTDLILKNLSEEAWQALGRRMPSYQKMVEMNERIARELDEAKTSLEDLKRTHDAVIAQNAKLSDATQAALDKAAAAERAKNELKDAYERQVTDLQARLNAYNDKILALEKARADSVAARHAMMTKLSMGFGAIAAICIIGAVFLPVGKWQLAITAAVSLFCSVAIWYLTGLVIACIAGAGLIAGVLFGIYQHRQKEKALSAALEREKSAATDVYRAIQRVKENNPEAYATAVKPELVEAHLKYETAADGTIKKVEDPDRVAFIDARLAEVGDK